MSEVSTHIDAAELRRIRKAVSPKVITRTLRKAGSTALRDMRSEANKRIRERKRIRMKIVRRALVMRRPKGGLRIDDLEWGIDVRGTPVPLSAYPHRQNRKGTRVEVNRGKRTLVEHAFVATMKSGHKGIYVRRGAKRLPIRELLGSRPADALLHAGEADGVVSRGQRSLVRTFLRLLPIEQERER